MLALLALQWHHRRRVSHLKMLAMVAMELRSRTALAMELLAMLTMDEAKLVEIVRQKLSPIEQQEFVQPPWEQQDQRRC